MRTIKFLLVTFAVLLFTAVAVMAQNVPDSIPVPLPPGDWTEVVFNVKAWFASFGGIAVLTAFVAAFLNGILQAKGFVKQLVAWAVAIALGVVSNLVNFGYMADYPILQSVVHGFMAGLAANGVFKIPILVDVLKAIEGWFKKSN